jgi:hypothetical protein
MTNEEILQKIYENQQTMLKKQDAMAEYMTKSNSDVIRAQASLITAVKALKTNIENGLTQLAEVKSMSNDTKLSTKLVVDMMSNQMTTQLDELDAQLVKMNNDMTLFKGSMRGLSDNMQVLSDQLYAMEHGELEGIKDKAQEETYQKYSYENEKETKSSEKSSKGLPSYVID